MTAASLGLNHGHVPVGYAGALDNPPAQIDGGKLSQTFAATMVRDEGLDYDVKPPDRQPA